jgi:hypothetical protein
MHLASVFYLQVFGFAAAPVRKSLLRTLFNNKQGLRTRAVTQDPLSRPSFAVVPSLLSID